MEPIIKAQKYGSAPASFLPHGRVWGWVVLFSLSLFLTSCRTTRKATAPDGQPVVATNSHAIVSHINANQQTTSGLRSTVSLKLSAGGKSASVGGQLKMKRDEIIQLNLTALGLIEVGRLEMTPAYLLIQDRMHKQYLQVAWNDVPDLQRAGIDFNAFQALFWNQLFVPGKPRPDANDFTVMKTAEGTCLYPTDDALDDHRVVAQFLIDAASSLIRQTTVIPAQKARLSFRCSYGKWQKLQDKDYPAQMTLDITDGAKHYTADITLTSPQADERMGDLATRVADSYRRVKLEDILTKLTGK